MFNSHVLISENDINIHPARGDILYTCTCMCIIFTKIKDVIFVDVFASQAICRYVR